MEQHETPQQTHDAGMPAETPNKTKKSPLAQFFGGLLIVLLVALIGVYIYAKSQVRALSEAPFVMQVADSLRIPIAKINGNPVLYTDFITDATSLKKFYAHQPEGYPVSSDTVIHEQVLSRLLVNALVQDIGRSYSVTVTQEDMDVAKAELLSQFPDEASAETEISTTFGWSLDTFTERVIEPIVLEKKVGEAFAIDESIDDLYKVPQVRARHILFTIEEGTEDETMDTATNVLKRIQEGEDFADLAKEFGADGTAEQGGELGWIDKGTTVPSFEEVLFSLESGELYDGIAKTEFGYHIIKAEEVRSVNDFAQYFQDQLKHATVKIYTDLANPFAPLEESPQMDVVPVDETPVDSSEDVVGEEDTEGAE